jgi:DNA integrity scanning protein DisA with diadenylate cyclase activity
MPLPRSTDPARTSVAPAEADSTRERRLRRLREELQDERVPISFDGPTGLSLLTELAHARRPVGHEGRIPRYGALIFAGVPDWDQSSQVPLLVPGDGVAPEALRRFADGRSSFTVVTPDGVTGLVNFEHTLEDEVSAVRLQRTGAVVVQRSPEGVVRVCTADGVVLWTGSRWRFKPLAEDYVRVVARFAPQADRAVLAGLLELAVHSLAAERVGATFIWNLDGAPPDDPRGGLLELAGAIQGPPLSAARRGHFPAVRSIASQVDLATVVAGDGSVGPFGVSLDHTVRAGELVPPINGARHTSARRFTFDVPGVLAVVVSESGRVTVFSGGAVAARIHGVEQSDSGTDGRRRRWN